MPDEPEALGLLALMLLAESRRAARTAPDGALVPLAEQDRSRWDDELVERGPATWSGAACAATGPARTRSRRRSRPCTATRRPTTGGRSSPLYDQLLALTPDAGGGAEPGGRRRRGGRARRRRSRWSTAWTAGASYHLFHAVRADLLRRLGRADEAAEAYERAIAGADNAVEQRHLEHRLSTL